MNAPQVSAIITTFNRSHFLPAAIESILGQTFADFELLIFDNESKDATGDVVASYSDPRIRYVRHPAMGISPQRNLAVKEARGDYIAFLDDDDVWLPNKLALQLAALKAAGDECCLAYGMYSFFDENGVYGTFDSKMEGKILRDLLAETDGFCGSASNPMLRRRAVLDVGGYPDDVLSGEDYYLYLKLARKWSVAKVATPVVNIRQHQGPRLIGRLDARIALEERILAEFGPEMDDNCRRRYLKKIGGKYVRFGDIARGRATLRKVLRMSPFDLDIWAQLAASALGKDAYARLHRIALDWKKRKLAQ